MVALILTSNVHCSSALSNNLLEVFFPVLRLNKILPANLLQPHKIHSPQTHAASLFDRKLLAVLKSAIKSIKYPLRVALVKDDNLPMGE